MKVRVKKNMMGILNRMLGRSVEKEAFRKRDGVRERATVGAKGGKPQGSDKRGALKSGGPKGVQSKGVVRGTGKGKGGSGRPKDIKSGKGKSGLASRLNHNLRGVALPPQEAAWKSLTRVYGLGVSRAKILCQQLGIQRSTRSGERLVAQVQELASLIGKRYTVGSDRRRQEGQIRNRYRSLNTTKGIRMRLGLPVRGQHTATNAKTARKLNPGRAMRAASSG